MSDEVICRESIKKYFKTDFTSPSPSPITPLLTLIDTNIQVILNLTCDCVVLMGVKPAAEAASAQQQGDEVDWKCLHYIEPLMKVRVHFNWFMSGEWAVVECAGCGLIHPLVSCQRWVDFVYVHTTADNIIRLCMYFSLSPQRSLNIFYLFLSLFYLVLSFKEFLYVLSFYRYLLKCIDNPLHRLRCIFSSFVR